MNPNNVSKISNFIIYQIQKNEICKKRVLTAFLYYINHDRKGFPDSDIVTLSNDCCLYEEDNNDIGTIKPKLIEFFYNNISESELKELDYFESKKDYYVKKYCKPDLCEFLKYYKKYRRCEILKILNISAPLYSKLKKEADEICIQKD